MDNSYNAPCPSCGKDRHYSSYAHYARAIRILTLCKSCAAKNQQNGTGFSYTRDCPSCKQSISYVSLSSMNSASERGTCCVRCRNRERNWEPGDSNRGKGVVPYRGERGELGSWNRGRKHSEESRRNISESQLRRNSMIYGKIVEDDKIPDDAIERSRLQMWKTSIRHRDKSICQSCGFEGKRLHAHHIIPVRKRPELRHTPSNGILLCTRCHISKCGVHGSSQPLNEKIAELRLAADCSFENSHPETL